MDTAIDAIILEIIRTCDSEMCDSTPKFRKLPTEHRLHLLLAMYTIKDVCKNEQLPSGLTRWRPSMRMETYFGVERHGLEDQLIEVSAPPALSSLAKKFSRRLRAYEGEIEERLSLIVSLFGMYKLGMLEYRGQNDEGLCEWLPTSKFHDEMENSVRLGEPVSFTEEVRAGRTTYSIIRRPRQ